MPVAVINPGRRPEGDSPLDNLEKALGVAKLFGLSPDTQAVQDAKAKKAQEQKLYDLEVQKREMDLAGGADDNNPNSPLMATIRDAAKKRGITLPEGITPRQARTNFDAFLKPNDTKAVDPFVEEMRRQKAEDLAKSKTPKGKLEKMGADQKARFDNVVLGIDAITGMESALANGDWTFSLIGDNDFTRNETKWNEAIGRMQSGGAIGVEEAKQFKQMVPKSSDSAEIQQKKLADMRVLMEQRFGTFGFDKSQAADLGLDPKRMGWQQGEGGGQGLGAGGALPKPKTILQNGHTYTLNPKTGEYE